MPFGEDIFVGVGGRTGDTGQRYSSNADDIRQKFTGYQKDSETNLDFAEARMYENRYGRFTAIDPLMASGKSANPQTFNRYAYAGSNPIIRTDPNGTDWIVSFRYQWVGGKLRVAAIYPFWVPKASGNSIRWGTSGTVMDQGQRRSYDASWVFFSDSTRKYVAVDFFEPRDPKEFGSLQDAQNQIQAWNKQAAVNFVAGVMSGYSVAFEFSGAAAGMGAETGSEVFAMGQRAGTGASIAAAVTGVGIAPFVGKIGGETFKILKGIRLLEGPLSQFTHAGKFGFDLTTV